MLNFWCWDKECNVWLRIWKEPVNQITNEGEMGAWSWEIELHFKFSKLIDLQTVRQCQNYLRMIQNMTPKRGWIQELESYWEGKGDKGGFSAKLAQRIYYKREWNPNLVLKQEMGILRPCESRYKRNVKIPRIIYSSTSTNIENMYLCSSTLHDWEHYLKSIPDSTTWQDRAPKCIINLLGSYSILRRNKFKERWSTQMLLCISHQAKLFIIKVMELVYFVKLRECGHE